MTSALATPALSDSEQAVSTATKPSGSTAVRILTICRSPSSLPAPLAQRLPRYPIVPAILMGRLAVATSAQGQKLGVALLAHAAEHITTSNIGAFALVVDAKDDAAQRFYEHHGFVGILGHPRRLVLPLATAQQALQAGNP